MPRLSNAICVVILLAAGAPTNLRAQASGQAWASEEAVRLQAIPVSISNLVKSHWYQIPASDLSAHSVPREWYLKEIKPKLDAYALSQLPVIKAAFADAFAKVNFDDLQTRRRNHQTIEYCRWIPATRMDGAIVSTADAQVVAAQDCQNLAKNRVEAILRDRVAAIEIDLSTLGTFDFEYPRWLIADSAANPLDGQAQYTDTLRKRMEGAVPGLQRAVGAEIASRVWNNDSITSPNSVCQQLLGAAFARETAGPSDAFQPVRKELTTRCMEQAHGWLLEVRPKVIGAIGRAFAAASADAPIKSERRLCGDLLITWLTYKYYPDDFRAPIDEACAGQAKTTTARLIATRAEALAARTQSSPATLAGLEGNHWFGLTDEQTAVLVVNDDPERQSVVERIVAAYSKQTEDHAMTALANAETTVHTAFDAAIRRQSQQGEKLRLCGIDGSGSALPAATGSTAPYRAKIVALCQAETRQFWEERVRLALKLSGVDKLDHAFINVGQGNDRSTILPSQLVAASALSGLQVIFDSGWTGVSVAITPFGEKGPRLEGRLERAGGSMLNLVSLDPLPGIALTPTSTMACLALTRNEADLATLGAVLSFAGSVFAAGHDMPNSSSLLMGHAASAGLDAAHLHLCLNARQAFAGQ